ncbi:MAG: PrsW family glutamic-type intramembrane protease [Candidatus Cloacimonetes bacterium]|nr:PrsW family glutamic-type intramembrane protease [Candidatus Cloacimonadota bacterium]
MIIKAILALQPVLVALVVLYFMDSFKLIRYSTILKYVAYGIVIAFINFGLNVTFKGFISNQNFVTHYSAPFFEELTKAVIPLYLIKKGKVGFPVDAAIIGFSVGCGFAFAENIYYLINVTESNFFFWIIRGFGTAVMHCGNTAIMAIISILLIDRFKKNSLLIFLPGILVAFFVHSLFNHFFLPPVFNVLSQIIILPLLFLYVFEKSEKMLNSWLQEGFDSDLSLLNLLKSGNFSTSQAGIYLKKIRAALSGEIIFDMLCYTRIYLELSIRAKGILMLKESGLQSEIDPDIKEKFSELHYLEKNIGKSGLHLLKPLLNISQKELWQIYFLQSNSGKPNLK